MTVLRPLAFAAIAALAASSGPAKKPNSAHGAGCIVTRVLADGREVRSVAPPGLASSVAARSRPGASAASASSRGSGRSSVSVSSSSSSASSSSNGSGFARAISSYTDELGRTVTTRRDGRGCTIVIDERTAIGEE